MPAGSLPRVLEPLIGDLGLVQRVLPATETGPSKAYRTQYHLTDNFFRFWFRFIEPNRGVIEFGGGERLVDSILQHLPEYMGGPFEELCRDWVRLAVGAGVVQAPVAKVGTWWAEHDQLDVVGLNAADEVVLAGECKWQAGGFDWQDLEHYLAHLRALGPRVRPDIAHLLFSTAGFAESVLAWAARGNARTLGPADLLAPFPQP
ncbi:MAG: DUF234 domain-containing protein [Chloroflexi bacterium]|nr:DUF234 domain-containing protein [Chloroflexota bacterium]